MSTNQLRDIRALLNFNHPQDLPILRQMMARGGDGYPLYAVQAQWNAVNQEVEKAKLADAVPPRTNVLQDQLRQGLPAPAPQPPPPQIMAQAPQEAPQGMAEGGKIRFDDGGLIDPAYYDREYPTTSMFGRWADANRRRQIAALQQQDPSYNPDVVSGGATGQWSPTPLQRVVPQTGGATGAWEAGAAPGIATPPPYTDTPQIKIAQPGAGGIRAAAAPAAYTPTPIQYGDIAAERAKIPQGTAIPEGLVDYKKMLAEMGADRQQNKWMAFAAGAARMGQTPGGLGKAASAGMEEGLQYLAKNNAVNREQQVAAMRERGAMGIAQDRQVLMNEEIARRALEDQARLGLGNAGLQQRAAEAAAHNATQLDVARIGLQGHMAQVGSYKQAQIDAGRERMMQTEFAKAVEEARKQLAPNMKYMDPVNGAALLQRDAEQAALQRMRMIKDSEKYFNFPQERAAPGFVTPPANGPMRAPIG